MHITGLITSPKNFFASLRESQPSLKWPAILITLMAVFSAITGYLMGELTGRLFAGIMQGLGTLTALITAVSSFFGPYLLWIISTIIFYALVRVFKGTGSFQRIAEITGYGAFPLILSSLIAIPLSLYYLPMVAIHPVTGSDPKQINAAVQGMILDPALHQFSIISSLISIILLIWSANIWAFGFENCCGLDTRKAMMAAGIPVLVYIVYTLATLFIFTPGGLV